MQPKKDFDLSSLQNTYPELDDFQILLKHTYPVYKGTTKVAASGESMDELTARYAAVHGEGALYDYIINYYNNLVSDEAKLDMSGATLDKKEATCFGIILGLYLAGSQQAVNDLQTNLLSLLGTRFVDQEVYKDTTVYLANMWFKGLPEASWHLGNNGPTAYEKQFVGIRPFNTPEFTFGGWNPDDDYTTGNQSEENGQPMRIADPYLYFAYLSKHVFIGDVALDKYDFDDVKVPHASESLTFSFNGHGISGSLIPGSKYRDKRMSTLRGEMYDTWRKAWYYKNNTNYSDLVYPLPLYPDEDWGLTSNNQTFISQRYNKFNNWDVNYVGSAVRRSDKTKDGKGGKYLAQQFTAPYYIAETLSRQMGKIANQIYNIYKSSSDNKTVNKAMIA